MKIILELPSMVSSTATKLLWDVNPVNQIKYFPLRVYMNERTHGLTNNKYLKYSFHFFKICFFDWFFERRVFASLQLCWQPSSLEQTKCFILTMPWETKTPDCEFRDRTHVAAAMCDWVPDVVNTELNHLCLSFIELKLLSLSAFLLVLVHGSVTNIE